MMAPMSEWSERICRIEASGLSLTELSESIGVPVSTLSDIKTGRSKQPRGMTAVRLYELAKGLEAQQQADTPAPSATEQRAA
jgi:transcriptional regulator with XRE-family HTH domain